MRIQKVDMFLIYKHCMQETSNAIQERLNEKPRPLSCATKVNHYYLSRIIVEIGMTSVYIVVTRNRKS